MAKHSKRAKLQNKGGTFVKQSNKKYSKLLKRKKSNKASVAKFNLGATGNFKSFSRSKKNKNNLEVEDLKNKKKRSIDESDEELNESGYEKQPRRFEAYKGAKRMKPLLPIKGKSGVIQQYTTVEEKDDVNCCSPENEQNEADSMEKCEPDLNKNESVAKTPVNKEKLVVACKLRIAQLATSILVDPVSKISCLSELKSMLDVSKSPIVFVQYKFVIVSLFEIYKDIIPSYKIRSLSEKEKDQKMKTDTRRLQEYEFSLLKHYKDYLQRLETIASVWIKRKSAEKVIANGVLSLTQSLKLGEIAVKCLCELLVTHPHFNFSQNILLSLVPFAACKSDNISTLCCNSLKLLYKQDKLGQISLEGVKLTLRIVKEKSYNLNPKLLTTLLYLKIKDLKPEDFTAEKPKKLTHKEKMKTMSRREFKKNKKMEKLETELEETAAEESKKKKMSYQTDIIKEVFLIYFNVLKKAPNSALLGAVLEGLAKFAHLINIEFFDDLIAVLHQILEQGNLDVKQRLHCIATVFTILSGQGAALNIDPLRFYTQCYKHMLSVNINVEDADMVPLLITCLDMMINKRKKQVSMPRIFAFTHRTCTLALQSHHHTAIALLAIIRTFVNNFPRLDVLLDGEISQANGAFLPELDDPEHCNAGSNALWGIHLLKSHYHPTVAKMASHISMSCPINGEGQLPLELSKKTALHLYEEYNPLEEQDFQPPFSNIKDCSKITRRMKMKQKKWEPLSKEFFANMNAKLENVDLVNSFKNVNTNM